MLLVSIQPTTVGSGAFLFIFVMNYDLSTLSKFRPKLALELIPPAKLLNCIILAIAPNRSKSCKLDQKRVTVFQYAHPMTLKVHTRLLTPCKLKNLIVFLYAQVFVALMMDNFEQLHLNSCMVWFCSLHFWTLNYSCFKVFLYEKGGGILQAISPQKLWIELL